MHQMLRTGWAHVQDHRGGGDSKVWGGEGAEQDKTWSSTHTEDTCPTGSILSQTVYLESPYALGNLFLQKLGKEANLAEIQLRGGGGCKVRINHLLCYM